MRLSTFFEQNSVDDFAVVDVSRLVAPKGFHPVDILPSSKILILFAKAIPPFIFTLDGKVKSFALYQLIYHMDRITFELSDALCMDGHESIPIPTFFPIRVHEGRPMGLLSLKHCAAVAGMGSLGLNTLLISERFGNRLCLSGVVSSAPLCCGITQASKDLCLRCCKCVDICPTKAITNEGVQATKCVNFRNPIPKVMRPFLGMALKSRITSRLSEVAANTLGWSTDMSCSKCLTVCPYFGAQRNDEKKRT